MGENGQNQTILKVKCRHHSIPRKKKNIQQNEKVRDTSLLDALQMNENYMIGKKSQITEKLHQSEIVANTNKTHVKVTENRKTSDTFQLDEKTKKTNFHHIDAQQTQKVQESSSPHKKIPKKFESNTKCNKHVEDKYDKKSMMENDPKRKNKLEQNDGGQYEKVKYKYIPEADDDYI